MNYLGLRQWQLPYSGLAGRVSDGPLALPALQQLVWFYAGDGTEVDESVTGSDGQPVTAWADKSTGGNDLAQVGAGSTTYHQSVAAFNGRGAIEFDGAVILGANTAGSVLANLTLYSLYVVFASTNAAEEAYYCEGNSASNNPQLFMGANVGGAGRNYYTHRDDAVSQVVISAAAPQPNDGNVHIFTARRYSIDTFITRIDGTDISEHTVDVNICTINRLTIGALRRIATQYYTTGQIACVAGYTADNYATIEPLLAKHYGVTLA